MGAAVPERPVTPVAVGILRRRDGRVLFAQRPPGKVYAGYWEFPGGKIEPGESSLDGLVRELEEELGIRVTEAREWLAQRHVYPHAHVELRFFLISGWEGELHPREGQQFAWQTPGAWTVSPMLPALLTGESRILAGLVAMHDGAPQ